MFVTGKRERACRGGGTKQASLRRLLYMAAMVTCRSAAWKPFYERALARGLTRIQAPVALGRKLARIAFALLKTQADYVPKGPHRAWPANTEFSYRPPPPVRQGPSQVSMAPD